MYLFAFLLSLFAFGGTAEPTVVTDPPNIFRSTDQGQSWIPFAEGLPEGASAGALIEHEGRLLLGTDYSGFYVLPAGAQKWEARNQGLPEKIDINSVAAQGDFIAIGTYHGRVFTSPDAGLHWKNTEPQNHRTTEPQNHESNIQYPNPARYREHRPCRAAFLRAVQPKIQPPPGGGKR